MAKLKTGKVRKRRMILRYDGLRYHNGEPMNQISSGSAFEVFNNNIMVGKPRKIALRIWIHYSVEGVQMPPAYASFYPDRPIRITWELGEKVVDPTIAEMRAELPEGYVITSMPVELELL